MGEDGIFQVLPESSVEVILPLSSINVIGFGRIFFRGSVITWAAGS